MKLLRVHRSGDRVLESGIYSVLHSTPHMLIEHQFNFEGGHFRPCRICPLGVLYRLKTRCAPAALTNFRATALASLLDFVARHNRLLETW